MIYGRRRPASRLEEEEGGCSIERGKQQQVYAHSQRVVEEHEGSERG